MTSASQRERLFEALPEDRPAATTGDAPRSAFARTGILPSQAIRAMIAGGEIAGAPEIEGSQVQPASLDLRLGKDQGELSPRSRRHGARQARRVEVP